MSVSEPFGNKDCASIPDRTLSLRGEIKIVVLMYGRAYPVDPVDASGRSCGKRAFYFTLTHVEAICFARFPETVVTLVLRAADGLCLHRTKS